jgi:hypothetical protein
LHHALALAERIKAQVILLRIEPLEQKTALAGWVDEAVFELLNRAREAGMSVSCNTLRDRCACGGGERKALDQGPASDEIRDADPDYPSQ